MKPSRSKGNFPVMLMRAGAAKYSFSSEKCERLAEILSEQYAISLNVQTVKWPKGKRLLFSQKYNSYHR